MQQQKFIIKNPELWNENAAVQKKKKIQEIGGGVVQPGENAGRSFQSSEIKIYILSIKNIPFFKENFLFWRIFIIKKEI